MNDRLDEAAVKRVRPLGRRLWQVLVVGGMALAAACAGNQKSGSTGTSGSDNTGQSGGSSGGGTGGW